MELHPQPIEPVINMTVKILKIVLVTSFLFSEGLGEHGNLNFAILLLYLYQFIHDIITFANYHKIFWEGGSLSIPTIATLIIISKCKFYKDRYLLLFCFIALLIAIIFMTGILNFDSYNKLTNGFLFPASIFIISSVWLVILNFRKPTIKN
ncbi:hypothetical protein SAMN05421847_1135 [Halpernia humi]|uniref:Uncharacterized protein n=1 Tax=Halpernia humi TaxID=493375 RepID=A0A1H5W8X1_9FLAO|nr:hypothetical protein SAMN05421847_1135 [Halpernia humi]